MRRGFTLLEVMVATLIMGIAVVGLVSGIGTSLRNAARLNDYDRAAQLARTTMDSLLTDPHLPVEGELRGNFDHETGWIAAMHVAEAPPNAGPGALVLGEIDLEIWWNGSSNRRELRVTSYRQTHLPAARGPAS